MWVVLNNCHSSLADVSWFDEAGLIAHHATLQASNSGQMSCCSVNSPFVWLWSPLNGIHHLHLQSFHHLLIKPSSKIFTRSHDCNFVRLTLLHLTVWHCCDPDVNYSLMGNLHSCYYALLTFIWIVTCIWEYVGICQLWSGVQRSFPIYGQQICLS